MDVGLKRQYGHFIGGSWVEPASGRYFETINPASGEVLAEVAYGTAEDVDRAVLAGWGAFEAWGKTSAQERSEVLLGIAERLTKDFRRFAVIETLDNGKPIRESSFADIPLAADHFKYFAGVIRAMEGSCAQVDHNSLSLNLKEPLGVVGQIIPWNFPLLMAAWKLAPALAAGNCVVIKPAEQTSLSLLELMHLVGDIIPKGVVNVVTGFGPEAGASLARHPNIKKVAFTGETITGRLILQYASENIIPVTLELGGKSPNILFEDAIPEKALEALVMGICFNQGQVCTAGSRALIQASVYEEFVQRIAQKMKAVRVGNPLEESTMMGPLVSQDQLDKVLGYIQAGKDQGARLVTGGRRLEEGELAKGFFVEPTLFADVDNTSRIAQEEIFGPVLCAIPFKDEQEALRIANETMYGLGAAVHTQDINRALRMAKAIQAGRVWVNTYHEYPAHAPFGGYKKSGFGRENHKMMLEHYTQNKNIIIGQSEMPLGLY